MNIDAPIALLLPVPFWLLGVGLLVFAAFRRRRGRAHWLAAAAVQFALAPIALVVAASSMRSFCLVFGAENQALNFLNQIGPAAAVGFCSLAVADALVAFAPRDPVPNK